MAAAILIGFLLIAIGGGMALTAPLSTNGKVAVYEQRGCFAMAVGILLLALCGLILLLA